MTGILVAGGAGLASTVTFLVLYLVWKGRAASRQASLNLATSALAASEARFDASQRNLATIEAQVRVKEQLRATELKAHGTVVTDLEATIKKLRAELAERATATTAASSLNEALSGATKRKP